VEELRNRFYDLIRNLRRVQARYFQLRNKADLELSKKLEAQTRDSITWIQKNPEQLRDPLVLQVRKMLDSQTQYYNQKSRDNLTRSKTLEREVDKAVAEFFDSQTSLFDE